MALPQILRIAMRASRRQPTHQGNHMKKIALAALLAASFGLAHAEVLTFEGVSTHSGIPAGYGGLNWSNFYTLNVVPGYYENSGYSHALESGTFLAFNGGGAPASISATSAAGFALTDGFFTGAWNNGLNITAQATFENGTTATNSFLVNTSGPKDVVFDWTGLKSVTFTSSGGTQQAGFGGSGTQFAIDNLNATPVPEPTSVALLLAGVGLLGVVARRRSI
jgi:hypothetical protein